MVKALKRLAPLHISSTECVSFPVLRENFWEATGISMFSCKFILLWIIFQYFFNLFIIRNSHMGVTNTGRYVNLLFHTIKNTRLFQWITYVYGLTANKCMDWETHRSCLCCYLCIRNHFNSTRLDDCKIDKQIQDQGLFCWLYLIRHYIYICYCTTMQSLKQCIQNFYLAPYYMFKFAKII